METLGEFLSPEAGQARRRWLDESLGQFIPPELRGWVGVGAELNPVTNVERAGTAAQRMTSPGLSGWDRMAAAGDMATNMGAVLAPVAGAKAGVPAANAIVEALTAASPMKGAVDDFMADEFGGVGFRAYHGSPHDFDRFSLDKIGTGEGAQAYGHGLYFAENEAVAKGYRDNLSLPTGTTARDTAARILDEHGGDYEAALTDAGTRFNRALANGRMDPADYDRWVKAQRMLMNKDAVLGRMYEVQINADPADFLDWDKPLREQSQRLQSLWTDYTTRNPQWTKPEEVGGQYANPTGKDFLGAYGEDVPHDPTDMFNYRRKFTEDLSGAGIPGIRYLDAGSRGAGDGSRNYVVFDDKMIEILRKYGLAGAVPLGALLSQPQDPMGSYLEAQQ